MEHRQGGNPVGIELAIKKAITNKRQGMGNHSHLQAVLLNILDSHIMHQRPAVNEFHPGQVGKEMAVFSHYFLPFWR